MNLLLITVDTLRADHLSCYGYGGVNTKAIDNLASEGVLFSRAYTPVPITLPSHTSIMTGLYPIQTGVRDNGTCRVSEKTLTMAEVLHQQGYSTAAFISAYVLDSRFGLDQGFDLYDDALEPDSQQAMMLYNERKAEEVTQSACQWLSQKAESKFFAWVHYFDPHAGYQPPSPFSEQYRGNLYNGEIAYTDYWIGRLLDQLKQHGLIENTLIVLTADHGESLGEHGEMTHAVFIYDSTLHIPLIFSCPEKIPKGKRVHDPVSTIDIMPTILSLLGLSCPTTEGINLVDLIMEKPSPLPAITKGECTEGKESKKERPIYCESLFPKINHGWSPLEGLRTSEWKYINAPNPELYHLTKDPKEISNIYSQHQNLAREWHKDMEKFKQGLIRNNEPPETHLAIDQETKARLSRLGYVWTTGSGDKPATDPLADNSLPDPKDMINTQGDIDLAAGLINDGKYEDAARKLRQIADKNPDDIFVRFILGRVHSLLGQPDLAKEEFLAVIRMNPEYGDVKVCLGIVYLEQGQYNQAIKNFKESLKLNADQYEIFYNLGLTYSKLGQDQKAIDYFQQALTIKSDQPDIHNNLGVVLAGQGQIKEAIRAYSRASELDPGNPKPYQNLASLYQEEKKWPEAQGILEQALIHDQNNPDLYHSLANIAIQNGKDTEAKAIVEQGLRVNPTHPGLHNTLGSIYLKERQYNEARHEFEQAIQDDPDFSQALYNLGLTLGNLGLTNGAISVYQKLLPIDPNHASAYFNLGVAYTKTHDLTKAIDSYQRAIKAEPKYLEAHLNLGVLYQQQGNIELARKSWENTLIYAPDNAKAHYNLGNLALSQRDFTLAVDEYQKAIKSDPAIHEAHFGLGAAYINLGKTREAIKEWQETARLNPNSLEARINLAIAYINQGDLAQARWMLSEVRQINPGLPIVQQLMDKIMEMEKK